MSWGKAGEGAKVAWELGVERGGGEGAKVAWELGVEPGGGRGGAHGLDLGLERRKGFWKYIIYPRELVRGKQAWVSYFFPSTQATGLPFLLL